MCRRRRWSLALLQNMALNMSLLPDEPFGKFRKCVWADN
jgi:hypothetical protein